VIAALMHLIDEGLLAHLYVLESRPLNEGLKTLRDCVQHGAQGTLVADAAMADIVRHADCVLVGADCVSADGFLLNKIGTQALALICKAKNIPFYVLCDSLKFSPQLMEQTYLEQRPESELVAKQAGDEFDVWNYYFEWTPIELITAFITERGSFAPDQISGLASD
jgi:translation initiation factor 2B subunit (eIF-2B alpha/beta/delta family)